MPAEASRASAEPELVRGLDLGPAASLVVGIVIGSGIFIGANRVAQGVESVAGLFGVWIGAGLLTMLGALTYAEAGTMFPRSGGDYVFAQQGLGRFWGFFNGWVTFGINIPASLAALALAFASQLGSVQDPAHRFLFHPQFSLKLTAIAILAIFAVINYLGVRQGGRTQELVTGAKVVLALGLVAFGLLSPRAQADNVLASAGPATAGLGVAFVGALWAYDGWTNVARAGGEIRNPQRNVPRSLIAGLLVVIAIYVLLTLTYLLVLGLDGMRGTGSDEARLIASRTADVLFGETGRRIVSVIIMVSILGPINGLTLSGPRVYFAMARDGLFPAALARVHEKRRVPHVSILFQSLLSMVLLIPFTFEQLTSYVILGSWVAYAVTGISLIALRRRAPDLPRPYRVPFYPWVPGLFVLLSAAFVVYLLADSAGDPEALLYLVGNLVVMALSLPVFRFFQARSRAAAARATQDL